MKWLAPALAYLAVGLGLFKFHSAWGALLGFHVVIIVSLLIARPNIPISILITSTNIKWIIVSILLCGSGGISLYFLWDKFKFANDLPAQVEALGLNSSNWLTFIAYFALVNPFIEEYFWRGYLGNPTKSLHLYDFIYSGFHGLIVDRQGTYLLDHFWTFRACLCWLALEADRPRRSRPPCAGTRSYGGGFFDPFRSL